MRRLFVILATLSVLPLAAQNEDDARQFQKLAQVFRYLSGLYVDEVEMKPVVEGAITGMLEELDPHSAYIGAEEMKGVQESFDGEFSGIGVEFNVLRDTVIVVNTIAGGPAERVGVRANDRIVRIDTLDAVGMSRTDVPKHLRGKTGTKVGIDIKPQGIHVMPYNQNINHYEGLMDASGHVLFVDGSRKPDLTKIFSGKVPENTEGIHVMASFLPADANLSDDPAEGFVEGNIISIIYKGDHYKYKIRSKNDVDYYVDDEWLWNMGDYVSVVVPDEKITYEVINKGARDD